MLRFPPDFGVWLWAGIVSVATIRPRTAEHSKARERVIDASLRCGVSEFT
jgi:hypothetical protein